MSEILRHWLGNRLGLFVDCNLTSFENIAQDGSLIAQILHNYGIIDNENLLKITKTYDIDIALTNLAYLRSWLLSIGINLTEECMDNIAHKKKSAAIRLFYQLYIILNSKTKASYLIKKNIDDNLKPIPIKKPSEKTYNACEVNELAVSPYVDNIRAVLLWHRGKYTEFKKKHDCKEYVKNLKDKLIVEENKVSSETDLTELNVHIYKPKNKLKIVSIRKPDIGLVVDKQGNHINDIQKGKQYISYLKQKEQKLRTHHVIENQVHKLLLTELTQIIIEKEDCEFKEFMSAKLLKQSKYEKQISVKLIEVRNQKYVMLENLQNENKILVNQKQQEYEDQVFQQQLNLTFKEGRYILNKKRQFDLNNKLWTEKCAFKYKKCIDMCKNILHDCMDLALKSVEYRETFEMDIPKNIWREWTALFCIEQPIFDIIQDPINILNEPEEYDESLTLELYRQNGLDESDFLDYTNVYSVWNIDSAQLYYEENHEAIELGCTILGYVVHRLLLLKYPLPEANIKPILPPTDFRTCILGLENHELLPILQKVLINKEIIVLEMPTVINYCLTAYRNESDNDTDINLKAETDKGGKGKQNQKIEEKKTCKKGVSPFAGDAKIALEQVSVENQTPEFFPNEEIKFSKKAELGKYAYDTLHLGLEINENLMIAMLVEYLKQLDHVKGWVLINFPKTINEAYMLEEVLNGKQIPDSFLTKRDSLETENSLENRDDIFLFPSDPYILVRQSKILPNLKPICIDKYESFFTSFVFMQFKSSDVSFEDESESSINQLINFYDKLLVSNLFYYNKYDISIIKDLVKYILKDDLYINQIYEELFMSSTTKDKKNIEEPSSVNLDKNKKQKEDKKKEKEKKSTSKMKNVADNENLIDKTNIEEEEIPVPPKPGEENWEYIVLPLTKDISRLLATTWQYVEDTYINEFKQLFYIKRIYQNQVIPYVHEVDTHMQNFIERPDEKQEYLHNYQYVYNIIDTDLREDDEFKAELHFRNTEFHDQLCFICDTRMKECEDERVRIINENWFTNHCCTFVNLYAKAVQLELDRCVSSLQLLQDYYSCMAANKPLENKLPKYSLPKFEITQWSSTSIKKSNYDKTPYIVANMLIDISVTTENSPFLTFLNSTCEAALTQLGSWEIACLAIIKNIEKLYIQKPGKPSQPTKKEQKVVTSSEDDMRSETITRMILEWNTALEGEILRTKFRLKLIQEKGIVDLNEHLYYAEQLFHNIYNRIQYRYNEEVESVDNICQIFARAIEACEPIKVRLVLDGAKFYIAQNMLFSPDIFTYKTVKERIDNFVFNLTQLEIVTNIFLNVAPTGSMPQRTFLFILQDMVNINCEECLTNPLPLYWHYLKGSDVIKLVSELYGTSEYIDWKDFIIWNLLLPYPTEYELLEVRRQFREMDPDLLEFVNTQQFLCVQFWFEEEFSTEEGYLRMTLIKNLLCKMFTISKDQINYSALLLHFCKDVDSILGVSKAFELSIGQLVCWDMGVGAKFVKVVRMQKQLEEERRQEILSTVNSVVESVLEKTLAKAAGSSTTFLDIDLEEQSFTQSRKSLPGECFCIFDEQDMEEETEISSELPELCYYLSYAVLLKIMTASFPWHCKVPYSKDTSLRKQLEDIYNSCRHEEFDNQVFMHEFINNYQFIDLLQKNSKFLERIVPDIIRAYTEICTCENKMD